MAFPLRLERSDVDDDAATRVGALAQAHHEGVARNAEILHGTRQREAVGRDDAFVGGDVDEAARIEVLRVHDGRVDVGEHLELARATHVVAVAGGTVADDALAVDLLHLPGLERLDHAVLFGHAADPTVTLDAHALSWVRGGARILAGGRAPPPSPAGPYSSDDRIGIEARGRLPTSSMSRCAAWR